MDDKKKIAQLEQDIKRLKAAFTTMERKMKLMETAISRGDMNLRRVNEKVDHLGRR